jgi:hypothetical protein
MNGIWEDNAEYDVMFHMFGDDRIKTSPRGQFG